MLNATSTKKRLSATVYYLLTGLALGWPGLLATGPVLPSWRIGSALSPLSLADIHLLVLGSMMTIAFGVLYQIMPIAFQAPPLPRHVLYWQLPTHVGSVMVMMAGFLMSRFIVVGIGGSLLLCNTVAYFWMIGRRYLHARNKTAVHRWLSAPFSALWLVILVGLFQAFFPAHITEHLILTHMLLGGLAFWGGLVLVFSYKLVPMFVISHGYKVSLPRCATLYFMGIALWIASNWLSNVQALRTCDIIGGVLLFLSLALYVRDMIAIVHARKKRRIVVPLYDAFLATFFLVLSQAGIILAVLLQHSRWLFPSIYLFAFGGLIALMLAYMQKIVPFLWFEYRFSKRPERKTAPLIDEMVPKQSAQIGMALYFVGVIAGTVGMLLSDHFATTTQLAWLGACCMTAGSLLVFSSLRHVLTIGGKRPEDNQS